LTVFEGNSFNFKSCSFYSLSDYKIQNFDNFHFETHKDWIMNEERYHNISEWVMNKIPMDSIVAIEGYAMGARGRAIFNIAENGGLLKWKLWDKKIPFLLYSPAAIKKFATGKGTATKLMMYDAWIQETGFKLMDKIQPKRMLGNPTTDIIDSYFICKFAFVNQN
jgi:Holliday junction resolvasome RuvABC endonuclease subunit